MVFLVASPCWVDSPPAHTTPLGAGAQHSAADGAKFREKMIERVTAQLEVNADQKLKLSGLADKLQEQRLALKGQSSDPRSEMQSLTSSDKFDRSRAQAIVGEKTAAISLKSPEVVAALGDFYDGLSTVQQRKVRDFLQRGSRTRASGGVGLGLYLSRLVAQVHGASWSIRNAHPGFEISISFRIKAAGS